MAKANKSRYAILGILANAPSSSGYDIRSIMKESTDFFWKETFSSIYPVLDTLEKEKLIAQLEQSSIGRKRTSYKITNKGLQALQIWLEEDVELEQARNELLLKVFFGDLSSVSTSIKHIEHYKQQILAKKLILERTRKTLPQEYPKDKGLPFWMISVEFGIRRTQASVEWCEYALDKLSKMKKKR
jgi:DNA-binding PadR family transcriptional regulator